MIRPVLTEIALFVMPFAAYAVFLWATRAGVLDPASWPLHRLASLPVAAPVLLLGSFVVIDRMPFEVTTLREDVETFGRRAVVRFGRDWRVDAQRRDFTMNALSLARDGVVHDYVGGIADLAARRLRFIGDPATRIAEDYL